MSTVQDSSEEVQELGWANSRSRQKTILQTVHEGVAGKRLVLVIRCEDPHGQFETETTSVIG